MKLLDTFAGIGGFSYAAEKLVGGFETTQFIEINPYCQKILNKHWSHVPIHDDITTFTAKSGEFDIITGGFPCQDISVAGLQKGITEETRSGLFFELMRVIRMVRPQYVVLRTWQRSLIEGWTLYSGSFPKQGMMQNGQLYQQVLWEPVINDQDGGSLPTPIASKAVEQRVKFKQGGTPLLAALLPTPTTMDHLPQRSVNSMVKQVTQHRKGRTNLANLREAVNPQAVELFNHLQSLPTPTAREWKDGSSQSTKKCKKQDSLGRAIHHTYPQNGDHMYLNPAFCEEMMGYEIGWTDLRH